MGLRSYERAAGDAVPPIPPKTAKSQRSWLLTPGHGS
jgi:hypothetical protein